MPNAPEVEKQIDDLLKRERTPAELAQYLSETLNALNKAYVLEIKEIDNGLRLLTKYISEDGVLDPVVGTDYAAELLTHMGSVYVQIYKMRRSLDMLKSILPDTVQEILDKSVESQERHADAALAFYKLATQ